MAKNLLKVWPKLQYVAPCAKGASDAACLAAWASMCEERNVTLSELALFSIEDANEILDRMFRDLITKHPKPNPDYKKWLERVRETINS